MEPHPPALAYDLRPEEWTAEELQTTREIRIVFPQAGWRATWAYFAATVFLGAMFAACLAALIHFRQPRMVFLALVSAGVPLVAAVAGIYQRLRTVTVVRVTAGWLGIAERIPFEWPKPRTWPRAKVQAVQLGWFGRRLVVPQPGEPSATYFISSDRAAAAALVQRVNAALAQRFEPNNDPLDHWRRWTDDASAHARRTKRLIVGTLFAFAAATMVIGVVTKASWWIAVAVVTIVAAIVIRVLLSSRGA